MLEDRDSKANAESVANRDIRAMIAGKRKKTRTRDPTTGSPRTIKVVINKPDPLKEHAIIAAAKVTKKSAVGRSKLNCIAR